MWFYGARGGGSVDFGFLTPVFDNLRAGVTLFFVLSGFLLFRPYVAAALRASPTPSSRAYFRNRALRILPAYWAILLAAAVLFHRELLAAPYQLAANLLFLQNYVPAYMPSSNGGIGIVPAWSLAIEVVFYLLVPVLGAGAIVLARRTYLTPERAVLVPVVAMALVGIASKVALRTFDLGAIWEWSFLAHADWFAAGMGLALMRVRWEDGRVRFGRTSACLAVVTAIGLILGAAAAYQRRSLSFIEYQTPIAAGCALLLGVVVFSPGSRLVRMLSSRPMLAAGLASYSLFLWHDPLVRAFQHAGLTFDGRFGFLVNLTIIGTVSGAASALTYRFVEKPALARKRAWQRGPEAGVQAEPVGSIEESDLRPGRAASALAK